MNGRLHWLGGVVACMAAGLVVACSGASFSEASGGDAAPDGTVDSGAADSQAPPPDAMDAADGAFRDARTDANHDADAAEDADGAGDAGDSDAALDADADDGAATDSTLADSTLPDTGPGPDAPDGSFFLGGTVTGLAAGASVVLQTNVGATATVMGSGADAGATQFFFSPPLPNGTSYTVTVDTQPAPQLCTVSISANPSFPVAVLCDTPTQVSTGGLMTCAVLSRGGVDCWGDNREGELGNGTFINSSEPVAVTGLIGVATAVTVGFEHACALAGGSVQCWGDNQSGQLGNGQTSASPQTTPVIAALSLPAIAIAAGESHTCAVLNNGRVSCWGDNTDGDLGNGSTAMSTSPVTVMGGTSASAPLKDVTAITAGAYHTCALSAGSIACWGNNANGQLGNGNTTSSMTAVTVSGISTASGVACGYNHTCAVLSTGQVLCWGDNANGELGTGTLGGNEFTPTPSSLGGASATAVACGENFTCATLAGGQVDCWGDGVFGSLGNGHMTVTQATPSPVANLAGAVVGLTVGTQQGCAISSAGIQCWGSNDYGEMGLPSQSAAPVPVSGLSGVTAVRTGFGQHACAITGDGGVECWGINSNAQLGNGVVSGSSSVPVTVMGLAGQVSKVVVGGAHTCALLRTGTIQCWGDDGDGQCGNGSTPTSVLTPTTVATIDNAIDVVAGGSFTCALLEGGTVECWGYNVDGQLGNGLPANTSVPAIPVVGLTGATQLVAGDDHACALLGDGGVACWGADSVGQLGVSLDGGNSLSPVTIPGLGGVKTLAAGSGHTCAVLSDGGIDCWGENASGQLGIGSYVTTSSPEPVMMLQGPATTVTTGDSHTCALLAGDGGVECWGANAFGSLGIGGPSVNTPVPVPIAGVVVVTAGDNATCALLSDGGVACWGWNGYGQLGNGAVVQLNVAGAPQ